MCIFTGPVHVHGTKIFTADLEDNQQSCVYQMEANVQQPVAMVLPIPVNQQTTEAVEFINLEKCKDFFEQIDKCWPQMRSRGIGVASKSLSLKVHDVGQYIASFVPSASHFVKLDKQFRLPALTLRRFKKYINGKFGYVVAQLKESHDTAKFHPMAFKYQPSNPDELFFPTVHIHNGRDYETHADYDHALYAQPKKHEDSDTDQWQKGSYWPKAYFKDLDTTQGLVLPERSVYRLFVMGHKPNEDYIFAPKKSYTLSPLGV